MNQRRNVFPPELPSLNLPYSPAVKFGPFLFTSGQIPLNPGDGSMVLGEIREQTRRVLENIRIILTAERLAASNVIKTTVYLAEMKDFDGMNEVYREFFGANFPARTTVAVAGLPKGARIEIEAIASYPASHDA
jgi:2-iminobutanoate/2-iminopropanoate deaminase